SVFVSEDAGFVLDLIKRCLVLAGLFVDRILIHQPVAAHDGLAVDEPFLGDGLGFLLRQGYGGRVGRSEARSADGGERQHSGERDEDNSFCFHWFYFGWLMPVLKSYFVMPLRRCM